MSYIGDGPGADKKRRMLALIQREHADQSRNGGRLPYWMHPQSVAEILEYALTKSGELAADDPLAIALYLAAQGHDLYEDTGVNPAAVRAEFGVDVDDLIAGMTNANGDDDRAAYLAQMSTGPETIRLIKLADLVDNTTSCGQAIHDLGSDWVANVFQPLAHEMTGVLRKTRFERFPKTSALLFALLDFSLRCLERNLGKFAFLPAPSKHSEPAEGVKTTQPAPVWPAQEIEPEGFYQRLREDRERERQEARETFPDGKPFPVKWPVDD